MKLTIQPWGKRMLTMLVLGSLASGAFADDPALWGIASVAECTGPDGAEFSTEIISLPDGTVRFVQRHGARETALLVLPTTGESPEGSEREQTYRRTEAGAWERAGLELASIAHGHDVHRLYLEAVHESGSPPSQITRTNPVALGGGEVTISFADSHPTIGVDLPRAVSFGHAGERFEYRFRSVLPFRIGPATTLPSDPNALFDRLADVHRLVALHERVMQAHRDGDVEAILADQAERGLVAGRGRIGDSTHDSTRQRLGTYLANSTFERYIDLVAPVVSVSLDGSLGWVACEMEAKGEELMANGDVELFEFGYTWLELYAEHDGRWLRTGNVSSARP